MNRTMLALLALLAPLAGCPAPETTTRDGQAGDGADQASDNPRPIIDGVDPARGPTTGGTVVEIRGQSFLDGARAFFGGREATGVEWRNTALLVGTTPAGDAGVVSVKVVNPDGQSAELAGGFRYEKAASVAWCALDRPASDRVATGQESARFFGVVEVPGRTGGTGKGDGILAQAGYGPDGSDPAAAGGGWQWADAAYEGDVDGPVSGDEARDEYGAAFTVAAAGAYDAAYRFSTDGGATWALCDRTGADFPAYAAADAAALDVYAVPAAVDSCILASPPSLGAAPGAAAGPVTGRVELAGFTDETTGAVAFIKGQVGYGPDGSDPTIGGAGWTWTNAAFDADQGSADRYSASFAAPAAEGDYDYAYRFSTDGGATWTACDRDGSAGGYSPAAAGALTVSAPAVTVDACRTQWPLETWTGPGFRSDPLYGRVLWAGHTEGAGRGAGIDAQVGWGPRASDPAGGGWTWEAAAYTADVNYLGTGDGDEYAADLAIGTPGDYGFVFRFSADGGAHWTLCDLDGSANGFDTASEGLLRVVTTTVPVDWCNLQWPFTASAARTGTTAAIYGRVFSTGVTSAAGRAFAVIGELGYGPDGSDPATAGGWVWKRANFNVDQGANDEYQAALSGFAAAGTFDYAYRFTGSWGAAWTYCDRDPGSTNGYQAADAGALTVTE